MSSERQIGFIGATSIGVGAIVGGGILALAGTALAAAGPSAMVAFALNGVIALLTALSFSELSAAYPQSGGSYAFAKRVLNVHTAFIVGWIVWFASIVAAVLYALGFAIYAVIVLNQFWSVFATVPDWVVGIGSQRVIAIAACLIYAYSLLKPAKGGGDFATIGKVVVFFILIIVGIWTLGQTPLQDIRQSLSPFYAGGMVGLAQAMGFTFIALQGFDLIAAVAGEVKEPAKNLPRSMITSLVIALVIYLPLLLVTTTVGLLSGENIVDLSRQDPEAIIAVTASRYFGQVGYWLVVVAALLAMMSALKANLFAASRIAQAMAKDRTMPKQFSILNRGGMPASSIWLSCLTIIVVLLIVPNLAAAGAAASLIFLISFALVHAMSFLARRRTDATLLPFKVPFFPLVPIIGVVACISLAVFQGIVIPSAGLITFVWLLLGLIIYAVWISQRAMAADAAAEALDPSLLQLRGRSPLVLVPLGSAENASALTTIANALTPTGIGRVLLLTVIDKKEPTAMHIDAEQHTLVKALSESATLGLYPEALTTLANDPWLEMARVAKTHRCETILLALSHLDDQENQTKLNRLLASVDCDVTVLYLPSHWSLEKLESILVPVAGGSQHDTLRTRLLASLGRVIKRKVLFLRVLSEDISASSEKRARRALAHFAQEEIWGTVDTKVSINNNAVEEILKQANVQDLIVLGSERKKRSNKGIGDFAMAIIKDAPCAVAVISHRV